MEAVVPVASVLLVVICDVVCVDWSIVIEDERIFVSPLAATRTLKEYVPGGADDVLIVRTASSGVVPEGLSMLQRSAGGKLLTWIVAVVWRFDSTRILKVAVSPR